MIPTPIVDAATRADWSGGAQAVEVEAAKKLERELAIVDAQRALLLNSLFQIKDHLDEAKRKGLTVDDGLDITAVESIIGKTVQTVAMFNCGPEITLSSEMIHIRVDMDKEGPNEINLKIWCDVMERVETVLEASRVEADEKPDYTLTQWFPLPPKQT